MCPVLMVLHLTVACRAGNSLACDGKTDDTAALQKWLHDSAATESAVVLPTGTAGNPRTCVSLPLVLPSHTSLVIPKGSVLKAGDSRHWPNTSSSSAQPFISTVESAQNISITGQGTIDGSGAQWWTGDNKTPRRPRMIKLVAQQVLLRDFLLLNGAAWIAELSGNDHRVYGIRIQTPDYGDAPNTDGLDISATNVHIKGVDITNGDDSICIKSPARNVLVEDSVVRQGNGLVIGTSDAVDISNITFQNCTAIGTSFGCHVKFKDDQVGHPGVRDILFQDVKIVNPGKYAIGINQNGQSLDDAVGSNVPVNNVTFRNIEAMCNNTMATWPFRRRRKKKPGRCFKKKLGGRFTCNSGKLACRSIVFDSVKLGSGAVCTFQNACGRGRNVQPESCIPPEEGACD